jgi:hypothetical protein
MRLSLEQFADQHQPSNTDPGFLRGWELLRELFDAPGRTPFRIAELLDFLKENRVEGYLKFAALSYENGSVAFIVENGELQFNIGSEGVMCPPDDFIKELELVVAAYDAQSES